MVRMVADIVLVLTMVTCACFSLVLALGRRPPAEGLRRVPRFWQRWLLFLLAIATLLAAGHVVSGLVVPPLVDRVYSALRD